MYHTMNFKRLCLVLVATLAGSCYGQQTTGTSRSDLDGFMKDMTDCAAGYTGSNERLSPISKCAIAQRKPELAVKTYELPCTSTKYTPELRAHFCPLGLLELSMFFSDPTNEDRDITKSRDYLNRLIKEFPESQAAKPAKELLSRLNNEGK